MKINVKITRQENADYFKKEINSVVEVEFEEYVAAVVASEIGNSNLEACKAQAIAARTYAVNRGVLNGKIISDDSRVAQAYRAIRYDFKKYPNCITAANDTKGIVVYYNNKPASTVYSSSNGGRTVSCKSHWGNDLPYLIEKNDEWNALVSTVKKGHGVGMSQLGAIYAGSHGFNYTQILTFYYPNTELRMNYGINLIEKYETIEEHTDKIKKIQSQLKQLRTELDNILDKLKEGL